MQMEQCQYVGAAIIPPRREGRRPTLDHSSNALVAYVDERCFGSLDESDIVRRLDALLDDDRYWELSDEFESLMPPGWIVRAASGAPPYAGFLRVGGAHLVDVAAELTELLHEQVKAAARFMTWAAKQPRPVAEPPVWADPSWSVRHRLDAPAMPAFLARGLLGAVRANLCTIVLHAPRAVALPLGVRAALFREAIAGLRQQLKVLASLPEAAVPEHIVPLHERLDLEFELQRAAEAERGYQTFLESARASGLDVYPPTAIED